MKQDKEVLKTKFINKSAAAVGLLVLAMCIIAPTTLAAESCDWTGTWTEGGQIDAPSTMALQQSGDGVDGNYTHNNGEIHGKISGKTLNGTWSEGSVVGTFIFMIADDCNSFNGTWFSSDGGASGTWTGTRKESELANAGVPPELGFNPSDYITEYDQDSYAPPAEPTTVEGWNAKGLDLYNQGKYDEAIQAFDKALNLNDRDAASFYNKGIALEAKGETANARQFLYKALDLGYPDNGLRAKLAGTS